MTETDLSDWRPCARPGGKALRGQYCRLEPLVQGTHGDNLFKILNGPGNDDLWDYVPAGPFETAGAMNSHLATAHDHSGWRTMVIIDVRTDSVVGMASYMRLRPEHGSAEVGCVVFSKTLQRTRAATEAVYLMAKHLFDDLGYRRFEWKCNAANVASRRAAVRFGFTFEGVFRNDMVVKGRSRDTAWYSMIDSEWSGIKAGFDAWLSPSNFDENGMQVSKLCVKKAQG